MLCNICPELGSRATEALNSGWSSETELEELRSMHSAAPALSKAQRRLGFSGYLYRISRISHR